MTDYTIPCETFARLASVLVDFPENASGWLRSIRIDNGVALATNRIVMVLQPVANPPGVIHVIADPAFIAQCRKETPYKSIVTITVVEALGFATMKTTMGYIQTGNSLVTSPEENEFDKWRSIVEKLREPASVNRGGMFWHADHIARLAAASPSGKIVFEETINAVERPTIVRDINDYDWCGVFNPYASFEHYSPATLPTWVLK